MYCTVPETYEPTGTVVSGLIVPVACTTAVMSPRTTLAVRNFPLADLARIIMPTLTSAITPIPERTTSFLFFCADSRISITVMSSSLNPMDGRQCPDRGYQPASGVGPCPTPLFEAP